MAKASEGIENLRTVLDSLLGKIPNAEKGVANGVATLDANAKIPAAQLPAAEGGGDVAGPANSTDGHVALFDGATGKLLKGGGAAIETPLYPVAGHMVVFEETNNGKKLASGGNVQNQLAQALIPVLVGAVAGPSELGVACIGTNAATAHQITASYTTIAQAGGNGLSGVTLPVATQEYGSIVVVAAPLFLYSMCKIYAAGSDLIDGAASTLIPNGAPMIKVFKSNGPGVWNEILSM